MPRFSVLPQLSAHRYVKGWVQSCDHRCWRRNCGPQHLHVHNCLPHLCRRSLYAGLYCRSYHMYQIYLIRSIYRYSTRFYESQRQGALVLERYHPIAVTMVSLMYRSRSVLEKLRDSKYGNDQDLDSMLDHFEKSTKPTFKDPQEKSFIKFGSMRDKDPTVGIRGGQLQLSGYMRQTIS